MKFFLLTISSSLIMCNIAIAQVNPYVGGAYNTISEVTGNQGDVIALPGGVRVYNQSSVNQALYGGGNMGGSSGVGLTGQVSQQSATNSDTNTTVPQLPGMVNSPNVETNSAPASDVGQEVSQTEKELEEMTKRNAKIMEDLKNRSQQFQNNGVIDSKQQQIQTTNVKQTGQIPYAPPKNRIGTISEWNTTTIDQIEEKAKLDDQEKYLNFLQNR